MDCSKCYKITSLDKLPPNLKFISCYEVKVTSLEHLSDR